MNIRNINLTSPPARPFPRLTSYVLVVVALSAGSGMAQDSEPPAFDSSLLDTCLENASLRLEQGDEKDAQTCIGVAANACMDSDAGSSTIGMSQCVDQELTYWDQHLNDTYTKVMAAAQKMDDINAEADPSAAEQVPVLQEMQRKWISFRDAACAFEQARWGSGTGAGPAAANCMMEQTAWQAIRLENFLDQDPQR